MTPDLSALNENQRQAIGWSEGPLLVLAGPGSGKTRVLTYRIARLLAESSDDRFRILGITFTTKAAAEMRNRLDTLVRDGRERALLTTFHSFAAEILRQHGSHVGLRPDFTILAQPADREAVFAEAVRASVHSELQEDFPAGRLLPAIDRLLDEGVSPKDAYDFLAPNPSAAVLASVYAKYEEILLGEHQLDFGMLLVVALRLLRTKPAVAKQLRRVYRHICVDEFQDTNAAQYNFLLELVPAENPNLFIVADDDQIIYQWNGADPKRLREIRDLFSMDVIQLPQNYRCPKEVVTLANLLIKHNDDRTPGKKDLTSHKPAAGEGIVRLIPFPDPVLEVAWIRQDILARSERERPECVVLARTRKLLEATVKDFQEAGLPAYIAVRKTEFQSPPLRWLHASLRLANSRQDREQVRRLCKAYYALEGVNLRIEDVVAQAAFDEGDFLRAWISLALRSGNMAPSTQECLTDMHGLLLERSDHWSFIGAAFSWFEQLKETSEILPEEVFSEYKEEAETWTALQQAIVGQYGKTEVTLHLLLQEMDLRSKEPPPPKGAIRCFTIHTAKGMEFKHVYLIGLAEDQLPSWAAVKKGDDSLEMREERRNCFVAITRTQESLTLTYAESYYGYRKNPSRFLREMGLIT